MKNPEIKNDNFYINGEQWNIASDVTVGRLPELEKLLHHFINGIALTEQQLILKGVYDDLNEVKVIDAGRKIYNLLNATNVVSKNQVNPKMLVATMFINRKGEDLTKWDMALAEEKLNLWKSVPAAFFLDLADKQLEGILTGIYGISQAYSKAMIEIGNKRMVDVSEKIQKHGTKSKRKLKTNG